MNLEEEELESNLFFPRAFLKGHIEKSEEQNGGGSDATPEEESVSSIQVHVDDELLVELTVKPKGHGKVRSGLALRFKKELELAEQKRGHAFVDEKGEVFRAVVCLAPYQKVPRPGLAQDKKTNTMETDPLFLEFLQLQNEPKPPQEAVRIGPSDGISPLVKHIQEKRRLKEERIAQAVERKRKARENAKATKKMKAPESSKSKRSRKGDAPKSEWRKKSRGDKKEISEETKSKAEKTQKQPPALVKVGSRVVAVQRLLLLQILERPASAQAPQRSPDLEREHPQGSPSAPKYRPKKPRFLDTDSTRHSRRGRPSHEVWRPTILKNLSNENQRGESQQQNG
ncbi:uncharacterized protein LOC129616894 [Condylostylus longicornis]|uniref:uncharacterized protein LOC129616894 n=1 Tax=Condylostylus longicornis TaxID=2530218 RepID=UPI00244E2BFF|nr:uncharacterized protein LOC129616894 [Condylostylus longicornis]